ncbi:hypothetical protein HA402_001164 [Bradysia odoriphaga]|nr:hypothetical protein HA402_001164 [Bradysia odoriphaga]
MPVNERIRTIQIKIVYPYEAITFCSCALVKDQSGELVATLPRMITKAASRKEYSDVKFSVEDRLVVAHKVILADRSEVFRRMFSWNADDPKSNEPIEIKDTSYAAFEMFIDVIYFGTVPSNSEPEVCLEIIVLADKYDIPDIKDAVEESAVGLMNSDNVTSMLITSDLHKAQRIKKVALEFFAKNPVPEISNVQDLANYPDLMVEVLTYIQKHSKKA